MKSNHLIRKTKFVRTLLILLFMAVPMQWAVAQLTLSTPRTTLGIVIKQIQSQSKYQFFYSDKLSSVTVDALQVKDASLTNVLNRLLKGKNISYKVEENIVYLSDKEESQVPQQQVGKERTVSGNVVDSKGEPLIGVSVLIKEQQVVVSPTLMVTIKFLPMKPIQLLYSLISVISHRRFL